MMKIICSIKQATGTTKVHIDAKSSMIINEVSDSVLSPLNNDMEDKFTKVVHTVLDMLKLRDLMERVKVIEANARHSAQVETV